MTLLVKYMYYSVIILDNPRHRGFYAEYDKSAEYLGLYNLKLGVVSLCVWFNRFNMPEDSGCGKSFIARLSYDYGNAIYDYA